MPRRSVKAIIYVCELSESTNETILSITRRVILVPFFGNAVGDISDAARVLPGTLRRAKGADVLHGSHPTFCRHALL